MRYISEPNVTVIDYDNNKAVFKFDKNGVYETNDDKIIKFMQEWKPFIKNEECNPIKVDQIPIKIPDLMLEIEEQTYKCKHCNKDFENKGFLMAHYRKDHKK